MRRKKTVKRRTYRRRYGKKAQSSGAGSMLKGLALPAGSMLYGAVRERISNAIARSSIGQKLPASQFTDEAVMLGLLWGGGKLGIGRKGIGASIIRTGKGIEWARVGETVTNLMLQKSMTGGSNGAPMQQYVYG